MDAQNQFRLEAIAINGTDLRNFKEVKIRKAENGFIVQVGCAEFVSQSFSEVASGLELFFSNPEAAKEKFLKGGK